MYRVTEYVTKLYLQGNKTDNQIVTMARLNFPFLNIPEVILKTKQTIKALRMLEG